MYVLPSTWLFSDSLVNTETCERNQSFSRRKRLRANSRAIAIPVSDAVMIIITSRSNARAISAMAEVVIT